MSDRYNGTVKFFKEDKGFGFITPDNSNDGKDVFVHITNINQSGLDTLNKHERVSYELTVSRDKECACEIRLEK